MIHQPIGISSFSSISSLGSTSEEIWNAYLNQNHYFSQQNLNDLTLPVASISKENEKILNELKKNNPKYKRLDKSVLLAILAARNAVKKAKWNAKDNFGINIGSSRGATSLFEKYHQEFLETAQTSPLSSPTTTLGNISSWVAHDLQTDGPEISHSITCSTALHSLLNGVAWLQSGMCEKFLVGGSEAPLTPFTLAQMQALKIYANEKADYPCRAFDLEKEKNTMVLGEGASMLCLEKEISCKTIAKIEGIGFATEVQTSGTSISTNAKCFQKSMQMAIKQFDKNEIDAIVMHAPGTISGDKSEYTAIKHIFNENLPFLTTNKWKIGHTFGASGLLSLELALFMLINQKTIEVPFAKAQSKPKKLNKILVNAVGFGGNAVSVLVSVT